MISVAMDAPMSGSSNASRALLSYTQYIDSAGLGIRLSQNIMARLISRLSKGGQLQGADRTSLENTPTAELEALLKVSGRNLHPTALDAVNAVLESRKPKPMEQKKKGRVPGKQSKRTKEPRPKTNLHLFDFSSFDYSKSLAGPRGSIKTFSGGGCNPR
jgi:hypothetical protein